MSLFNFSLVTVNMKTRTFQVIILLSVVTRVLVFDIEYYDLNKSPELFSMFVKEYQKVYKDMIDFLVHYEIFKKNVESINDYNRLHRGLTKVYMDEYADMTEEELQALQDQFDDFGDNTGDNV
ncbi:hypothetical protein PYW08_016599 [Mythimna loreyi]|uniref:Uncharacterized protein n=1 Tax=Mythimna loreyi TaxID=667449 RepID=A0ACC2QY36_9NEOP|nr:hypothetical protein PYW08_016599 [Mythimna loreyi]